MNYNGEAADKQVRKCQGRQNETMKLGPKANSPTEVDYQWVTVI